MTARRKVVSSTRLQSPFWAAWAHARLASRAARKSSPRATGVFGYGGLPHCTPSHASRGKRSGGRGMGGTKRHVRERCCARYGGKASSVPGGVNVDVDAVDGRMDGRTDGRMDEWQWRKRRIPHFPGDPLQRLHPVTCRKCRPRPSPGPRPLTTPTRLRRVTCVAPLSRHNAMPGPGHTAGGGWNGHRCFRHHKGAQWWRQLRFRGRLLQRPNDLPTWPALASALESEPTLQFLKPSSLDAEHADSPRSLSCLGADASAQHPIQGPIVREGMIVPRPSSNTFWAHLGPCPAESAAHGSTAQYNAAQQHSCCPHAGGARLEQRR